MEDYQHFIFRYLWIPLAAVMGSLTALASSKVKDRTPGNFVLSFLAGFSFAIFVSPWIAIHWFGVQPSDSQALAGFVYTFGAGSNILLPALIGRLQKAVGGEKEI